LPRRATATTLAGVLVRRALDTDDVRSVHLAAFARPLPGGGPPPEAGLVDALRAAGDLLPALSFVAVLDGLVAGHVATSAGDVGGHRLVAVGPLGVLPASQRRGVGSALMHAALGAADALGEPAVALLGSPAYYGRFGFERADAYGVTPPDPAWGEHFMLRRLTAWTPAVAGAFRYPAAFDGL
jgi:putative acetyltransferase